MKMNGVLSAVLGLTFAGLSFAAAQEGPIVMGDGEKNRITVDGVVRKETAGVFSEVLTAGPQTATRRGDATTLVFPNVQIEGDGWLVMHPFVDGRPSATMVAGYTFVPGGTTENVAITLDHKAALGDRYVVMLHGDVDGDKVFDFVFVDDVNVEDKAVFEGNTIIAHAIAIP